MANNIPITSEMKLIHSGVFDMKFVYGKVKNALGEEQMGYDVSQKDFEESDNYEGAKHIQVKLTAEKEYNEYLKIFFYFVLRIDCEDEKLNIDGIEKKLQKGKAILIINAWLQHDYSGKKDKGPFMKFLSEIYEHYFNFKEEQQAILKVLGDRGHLINQFQSSVGKYNSVQHDIKKA